MQRRLPEAVASVRGEPQLEHQAHGRRGAAPGDVDNRRSVVTGEAVAQLRQLGQEPFGSGAVATSAGADEPVDVSGVFGRAVASQGSRDLLVAGADGLS
jgi:hypothetical protein